MAGSPRWISELSDMADEVRDRTIIVKIRSQLHSWSDLDIQSIFSEFGMIEEVKLLSVGGGFHSQVRYRTIYDSEWAYYYYHEGWFVHQNCCEIRVYRADEVVSWNANLIEANEEEKEEESPQLVAQDEPISEKDHSVLVACQLLEEMPRPIISQEVMFLDEIEKMNDDLVDRLDLKVLPLSSVEELYCSESFHEFQVSNMRSFTALSLSKIEYIDWFKILNELPTQKITMMDYIGVLCFDPGGGSFRLIDISIRKWLAEMTFVFGICLYSTAETIDEGEGSSQIRRYEPIFKTEISFQNACHVLDKIPELEDCHFPEELMVMRNALVTKVLSLSTYGLLIEDVARLDVIYFDLGGAEFIFCVQIGQNVCCKLISLDVRGEALNPTLASVVYVPEFKFYVLFKLEMTTCLLLCVLIKDELVGELHNRNHFADLLAAQFSVLMLREGYFLDDHVQPRLIVVLDFGGYLENTSLRRPKLQFLDKKGGLLLGFIYAFVSLVEELDYSKVFKAIAAEWKPKLGELELDMSNGNSLEAHACLQLLDTFCIASDFDEEMLSEPLPMVSRRRQAADLYRSLGLADKMPGSYLKDAKEIVFPKAEMDHHKTMIMTLIFDPGGHCSRLSAQARVELLMMLLLHLYGFATEFVILEDKDLLKRGVLWQEYGTWFSEPVLCFIMV